MHNVLYSYTFYGLITRNLRGCLKINKALPITVENFHWRRRLHMKRVNHQCPPFRYLAIQQQLHSNFWKSALLALERDSRKMAITYKHIISRKPGILPSFSIGLQQECYKHDLLIDNLKIFSQHFIQILCHQTNIYTSVRYNYKKKGCRKQTLGVIFICSSDKKEIRGF